MIKIKTVTSILTTRHSESKSVISLVAAYAIIIDTEDLNKEQLKNKLSVKRKQISKKHD